MKYEVPHINLLISGSDPVMVSFEGNTLDLRDMLIGAYPKISPGIFPGRF